MTMLVANLQWENSQSIPRNSDPQELVAGVALADPCPHLVAAWRTYFNHHRPHTILAGRTPVEYVIRSKEDQILNRANLNERTLWEAGQPECGSEHPR